MSEAPSQPTTSWFGRNWKWLLPVGCLTPLVCCGGGLVLVFSAVFGAIKSSEPYAEALAKAKAHPELQAQLGDPIEPGFFVSGNVSTRIENNVESGEAALTVPISGPKGSATIQVVAEKVGGKWSYSKMEAEVAGQDLPIDLLAIP